MQKLRPHLITGTAIVGAELARDVSGWVPAFVPVKMQPSEKSVVIDVQCGQAVLTVNWPATDPEAVPDSFVD